MTISDQQYRNGFISNNNAVQVNNFDLVAATYGASNFGEKGVANHGVLKSMFSMPPNFNDSNFSKAILTGRSALEPKQVVSLRDTLRAQATARLTNPSTQLPSGGAFGDLSTGPNPDARENFEQNLDFEEQSLAETPLEGSSFNPDFASGSVSFSYSNKPLEINKSKDGITPGTQAPNAIFAKQGLENPEVVSSYIAPLKGQGGFGNDALVNQTSPEPGETINTIINRY